MARSILFVDHAAEAGGAQLALRQLATALAADGWEVAVAAPEEAAWTTGLEEHAELVPLRGARALLGARRNSGLVSALRAVLGSLAAQAGLVSTARRLRPGIVYANTPKAALLSTLPALLARVPHGVHIRDAHTPEWFPNPVVRAALRWTYRRARLVVANSQYSAGCLERADLVSPSALDPSFLEPVVPRPGNGRLRVVLVARLDPWKGQDLFLEACRAAFPAGNGRCVAVLVGGPLFGREDFEAGLRRWAEEHPEVAVEFRGQVTDVKSELDRADVVVSATRGAEPLGQTIMQAQARGRCVVAPAAGGPLELVVDGETGYRYEPESVDDLARVLRTLIEDPRLVERVEGPAREQAAQYSREVLVPRFIEALEAARAR